MSRKRLEFVQAYRGIVAILILISHVSIIMRDYTSTFKFFHAIGRSGGVDFFFTLSGFLIFYVYSGYKGNKEKIAAFFEKRCLRIYPIVWFFTLLSLPVYAVFTSFGNGNELEAAVIVKSLFLFPQGQPVLGATWSLSHIVLFYMIFTLYLIYPAVMKYVVAIYACAIVIFNVVIGYVPANELVKFIISPFNLNFAAGALCAFFVLKYGSKVGYAAIVAGISGFMLNWLLHYYNHTEFPLEPVYLISSLCLLYGASKFDGIKKLPKVIDTLGNASYSIIITNLPITILSAKLMDKLGLFELLGFHLSIVVIVLASTIGGVVAYYIVEKPLSAMVTQMYYTVKHHRIFQYRGGNS